MIWVRWILVLVLMPGVIAMAVSGPVSAQTAPPAQLMSDANEHYERGEYAEAVQLYESLIGQGYREAALYYNLANAYLESGDLGRSILNFLRAEELAPRDPDILLNLELARSHTVDELEAEGDSLVASVADFGRRWATTFEFGLAALLLWTAAGIAICILILRRAIRRRILMSGSISLALVLTALLLVVLSSMLYSNPYENTGVVTARTVEILDGPGVQFDDVFSLHSGAQVRLTDSRHGWLQIALPGGELEGWAPSHTIEAVREVD